MPPIYSLLANIQLARARKAPKLVLQESRKSARHLQSTVRIEQYVGQDDMRQEHPQAHYHREATQYMNLGEKAIAQAAIEGAGSEKDTNMLTFLTRGMPLQN